MAMQDNNAQPHLWAYRKPVALGGRRTVSETSSFNQDYPVDIMRETGDSVSSRSNRSDPRAPPNSSGDLANEDRRQDKESPFPVKSLRGYNSWHGEQNGPANLKMIPSGQQGEAFRGGPVNPNFRTNPPPLVAPQQRPPYHDMGTHQPHPFNGSEARAGEPLSYNGIEARRGEPPSYNGREVRPGEAHPYNGSEARAGPQHPHLAYGHPCNIIEDRSGVTDAQRYHQPLMPSKEMAMGQTAARPLPSQPQPQQMYMQHVAATSSKSYGQGMMYSQRQFGMLGHLQGDGREDSMSFRDTEAGGARPGAYFSMPRQQHDLAPSNIPYRGWGIVSDANNGKQVQVGGVPSQQQEEMNSEALKAKRGKKKLQTMTRRRWMNPNNHSSVNVSVLEAIAIHSKAKGISQRSLARKVGASQQDISLVLRNMPCKNRHAIETRLIEYVKGAVPSEVYESWTKPNGTDPESAASKAALPVGSIVPATSSQPTDMDEDASPDAQCSQTTNTNTRQ